MRKIILIQAGKDNKEEPDQTLGIPLTRKLYSVFTREKFDIDLHVDSSDGQDHQGQHQSGLRSPHAEGEGPSHPQQTLSSETISSSLSSRTLVDRILRSQEVITSLPVVKRPSGEGDQVSSTDEDNSDSLGHIIPHILISTSLCAFMIWFIS